MKKKIKTSISVFTKVLFTSGLIFWLIQSGKIDFNSLSKVIDLQFISYGLVIIGLAFGFIIERWRNFLRIQKCELPFWTAFQLTMIGIFFNFVVPGGVGGDLIKGYYVAKFSPHSKAGTAMTVLLDRLIGLLAILFMSLGAMILNWPRISNSPQLILIFIFVFLMSLGLSILWMLIFSKRLYNLKIFQKIISLLPRRHFFEKIYSSLGGYSDLKKIFFKTFLFSICAQLCTFTFFIYTGQHMGFNIPMENYFLALPIAFVVQAIPISPGGIGVGQAATFFLFNLLNEGTGPVVSNATTAHQFIHFFFGLSGAIFYIILTHRMKIPRKEDTEI